MEIDKIVEHNYEQNNYDDVTVSAVKPNFRGSHYANCHEKPMQAFVLNKYCSETEVDEYEVVAYLKEDFFDRYKIADSESIYCKTMVIPCDEYEHLKANYVAPEDIVYKDDHFYKDSKDVPIIIDEILEEKGEDYGRADMFMGQLAQVWGAMLGKHLASNQVVAMMIAMKAIRGCNNPDHKDSFLDAHGYSKIGMDILKDDWV